MSVLVYIGPFMDKSFLNEIEGYNRYILIDNMPQNKHISEQCVAYKYCSSPEVFFNTLYNTYGKTTRLQ